jgi:DNA-binding transcriptional ArsR family regulator
MTALTMPAFLDSLADHRLNGDPRKVYNWMLAHCDLVEWRVVKRDAIATLLGMSAGSASNALRLVVERGFVDAKREGRHTVYRLLWSRRTPDACPANRLPKDPAEAATTN